MTDAASQPAHLSGYRSARFRLAVGLTLGAVACVAVGPLVLDTYTINIMVRSFLYAAAALTVDLLWGYTGALTFGQSAFFGIGAYAAALAFTYVGFSPTIALLALLGAILAAALVAAAVGWISFFHGASPLYVAIVTLALPIVLVQILYSGGTFTGSSSGLVGYETFDFSVEGWFWITGCLLIGLTLSAWTVVSSDFGRVLVAIRENEQRCAYLGIDTARVKIGLMVVMAAVAAVAGYALAGYTVVVSPELAGFVFGTELVIWVALGGRGTLIGPVLGTVSIDVISAYLSGNLPYVWKLLVGVIFVVVIVALPQGLLPVLMRLGRRGLTLAIGPRPALPRPVPVLVAAAARHIDAASLESRGVALKVEGLSRSYGSLHVLEDVHLTAHAGELVGIVGPNGAGKTTLMRCLSDGLERSGGTVALYGQDIGRLPPARVAALGLGRSFQTTSLFETLSVAECLRLARFRHEPVRAWSRAGYLPLPGSSLRVLAATGLDKVLDTPARLLSHGQKRALELAMVLALEPGVLLLDEPTAGLTKPERTLIGSILADLTRMEGLCVLLIEHDLDFVREISSRIVVLHQGKVLLDGSVEAVVGSDLVRSIYSGVGQSAPTADAAEAIP